MQIRLLCEALVFEFLKRKAIGAFSGFLFVGFGLLFHAFFHHLLNFLEDSAGYDFRILVCIVFVAHRVVPVDEEVLGAVVFQDDYRPPLRYEVAYSGKVSVCICNGD